jgi:outer membrane protein TolC
MRVNLGKYTQQTFGIKTAKRARTFWLILTIFLPLLIQAGCQTPADYRLKVDETASNIISEKQKQALGRASEFSIEQPSDTLRRRLLLEQNLPYANEASLGTDKLKKIEHWPEENYPREENVSDINDVVDANQTIKLSLIQALEVGARNSFDYQTQKEEVFKSALALDLEKNEFRNIFFGQVEGLASTDSTGNRTISGTVNSGDIGLSRKLESGAKLSTALAIDLANLMTLGGASSLGLAGDATISVPLLRGSGRHIITEALTQAERNVVYAIWEFERFKKQFAVGVASDYLSVLSQLDSLKNSKEDYRSRIASSRRSRRLADAGRLKEIEVDQAVQNELRARQGWISATERYKKQLDSFKTLLGLPPDSKIDLDSKELELLTARALEIIKEITGEEESKQDINTPPADAAIDLVEPSKDDAGPLEMEESTAIELALENRLDLEVAQGEVYDFQRAVVVAADALGAELTFFGSAALGSRRVVKTADLDNAQLRTDKGVFSAVLTLDLPFERTAEAINYRNSFINLERAVRNTQILEDQIKLEVRNELRNMLEARENLHIQAQAVFVAEKRVKSVNLFLEAGRAQIRDLLEAQDALLSAQNGLTTAVVGYRIAELSIQRDMGLLKVDEKGLWQEYSPEASKDVQK